MNIIFFGSDDFAEAHLNAIIHSSHSIAACVTQPDRPKGRGMKMGISSVKACALKHGIPVLQPSSLKETSVQNKIKDLSPDLIVVIAYGKFLPKPIRSIPGHGAIYGDRFLATQTARNLFQAGHYGRKTGRGLYNYKK